MNLTYPNYSNYSLEIIKDEVSHLLEKGVIKRHQPIYILCNYIPMREWIAVEIELERCDYLLRDQIQDLISSENWDSD